MRALLQQALDALINSIPAGWEQVNKQAEVLEALRAELAKPEQPAQVDRSDAVNLAKNLLTAKPGTVTEHGVLMLVSAVLDMDAKLLAQPAQEPLTDERIGELSYYCANTRGVRIDQFKFARDIEKAHGIGGKA